MVPRAGGVPCFCKLFSSQTNTLNFNIVVSLFIFFPFLFKCTAKCCWHLCGEACTSALQGHKFANGFELLLVLVGVADDCCQRGLVRALLLEAGRGSSEVLWKHWASESGFNKN